MAFFRFPFRIMAFPDDLHLAGIIDEIQFQYTKGHGVIDLRLVLYSEDGENPFVSDALYHIPVLHQRRFAALLCHPDMGGLLNILFIQFLRRNRISGQQRPVEKLGKIFVVCLKQQGCDRVLFHALSGDFPIASVFPSCIFSLRCFSS